MIAVQHELTSGVEREEGLGVGPKAIEVAKVVAQIKAQHDDVGPVAGPEQLVAEHRLVEAVARDPEVEYLPTRKKLAAEHGVPYVILRAISDTAAESLPDFLVRCQAEDGHISRRRVARAATLKPWRIPVLWKLQRRVRRCSDRLANSVEALLAERGDVA